MLKSLDLVSPITHGLSINFNTANVDEGFIVGDPFPSSLVALKLEGSAFFCSDPSNVVRIYDINSGHLRYILRVPLIHGDPTVWNDVCGSVSRRRGSLLRRLAGIPLHSYPYLRQLRPHILPAEHSLIRAAT